MLKRLSALLLFVAMLCASVTSCADDSGAAGTDTDDSGGTAANTTETTAETTEDLSAIAELPETNFNGETITILGTEWWSGSTSPWSSQEMYITELTGSLVNDAFYNRNLSVEQKYGVSIDYVVGSPDLAAQILTEYNGGTNLYDIAFPRIYEMNSIVSQGLAVNLREVPYINFDKTYWSQTAADYFTINGKTYFASGDINMMDRNAAYCTFFNKSLAESHKLDDLYQVVRDGRWTNEYMATLAKDVSFDSNGDSVMDANDTYGIGATSESMAYTFHYNDNPITKTNANGQLELVFSQEKTQNIVEQILNYLNNNIAIVGDWAAVQPVFLQNRALFYIEVVQKLDHFRAEDIDFGVLPNPKYDENQPSYTTMTASLSTVMSIPMTAKAPETSAFIAEALAYESSQTVIPAYFETSLETKYARDEQTAEMLQIIFDGIIYDIGSFNNIGGMADIPSLIVNNRSNSFSSEYASRETAARTAIEEINAMYAAG